MILRIYDDLDKTFSMTEFLNRSIRLFNRYLHQTYFYIVSIVESCYMHLIGVRIGS